MMMQEYVSADIARSLSHERLAGYRRDDCPDATALGRYLWNIALTESLYPSLNVLEVALRNSMDRAIATDLNDESWLTTSSILLTNAERQAVATGIQHLKAHRKPVEHGRMVAEMTFGFWTSLLDKRHEQALWPRLLGGVFPNAPRPSRTRKTIAGRLNRIRELRNRAFHHEPIWYRASLLDDHAMILETTAWISPMASDLIAEIDRFGTVFAARPD